MPANKNGTSQATISSFFRPSQSPDKGKRRRDSPIEISSDDDQPSKKKSKGSSLPKEGPEPSSGLSSSSTSLNNQWRFVPLQSTGHGAEPPQASDDDLRARKLRHEAFKKRLLQDNNRFIDKSSETPEQDVTEVDSGSYSLEDEEEEGAVEQLSKLFSSTAGSKRKVAQKTKAPVEIGPSGQSYTPLELQIRKLKAENPGAVLMVEVGYKYKFFGEDAKIAAKELGMVAFNDRNFLVASIPIHRRNVHLKKLLAQGYKVGIVAQLETAALKKVGSNKNALFERNVSELYTAATFVDELDSVDDTERYIPPPFMCIIEDSKSEGGVDVSIGFISVTPSTGEVVWDDFSDTLMRIELETRLAHIKPTEILLSRSGLSDATSKILSHIAEDSSPGGSKFRTEHFIKEMAYTDAFQLVSKFYTDKSKYPVASESFRAGTLLATAADFPKRVIIALAQTIKYLGAFGVADAFLETEFFTKFSAKTHMLLAANTLTNLEIYNNQTDYTVYGSLLWILDKTKTKFGARLLRSWIGRPLVDKRALEERMEAIQEIVESNSERLACLGQTLKGLPDLTKGLSRILYGKCSPPELCVMLRAFQRIAIALDDTPDPASDRIQSNILNEIISKLSKLKPAIENILSDINLKEAEKGKKDVMWTDEEKYPKISDAILAIQHVEADIANELNKIRKLLKLHSLEWTEVAGDEYLIQVKKSEKRLIPEEWILHSKTKMYERYQPPKISELVEERARHKETLQAEANAGYQAFLRQIISSHYTSLRDVVNKLATADCLFSFAHIALQEDFVRPQFVDDQVLEIVDGRHPMIEVLRSDPFVPNSIDIGGVNSCCKIITGPNMGGKSSLALMAQVGSYVPATSVKMGLLDSILTRMGASDDLAKGRSTFMVEMSETSEIVHAATERSLVILDELGRGTSTFDGMAIADAVLRHLVQNIKCKTLFITHYPLVASSLQAKFPSGIENLHMGYQSESRIDGTRSIIFLYQLTSGMATESFGVECGRLAGLPEPLLTVAAEQSTHMQASVEGRIKKHRIRKAIQLVNAYLLDPTFNHAAVNELSTLVKSIMNK
ncbi:DNA mismatch repair protein MSH3 [Cyathus striatus]|nr:DNA mismatch repair protein MSH3 [Cyathus striatus]